MAKSDVVAAQKAAVLAGQDAALEAGLEACYDQGAVDQKASDGTLTQADVDAAVKAAVDPLNAQIAADAQALADAQSQAQAAMADLQGKLDAMTAKEQSEEAIVQGLQSSAAAMQSALDALKAIIFPAPPSQPAS